MPDAIATLTAHAQVLRQGGAPHQQDLAQAIEDVLKLTADPAGQVAAAHALLADRDRHLVEATAQHARAVAAIERTAGERERLRGEMHDAVAARDEATRHRDEAQQERDALNAKLAELNATVLDLQGKVAATQADLDAKNATGIATTAGDTLADIKADLKTAP